MIRRAIAFVLLALSALPYASAQPNQANVSGVITDVQEASVAGASVIAADSATGVKTTVTTNASGFYSIPNLPVGAYTLTVEAQGFRRYVRDQITISTGQVLGLNIRLELGGVNESVTVSGEAPQIESRTSDITQLIESKSISDLPLGDRRTMNAINLTGGAVFLGYNSGQKPEFSLAGGRTQSQMFWIDGGTGQNMRMGIGQMDLDPPVDAVEEIKVLSNNYSAQYGGSAGGVVVVTTKSGTNQFHGSLFEYFRNNALDAPGFFAPIQNGRKVSPELRSNIFGGTIGGPIRRNKTFFFFAYQGRPRRSGAVDTVIAPTALQRAGDFSQTFSGGKLVPIYDPATTQTVNGAAVRTQFPGNVIPPSRFDPVGAKAIQFYPLPNAGTNTVQANYVFGLAANFYEAKVDHNFNDKDRLTVRYLYDLENTSVTSIYPDPAADPRGFLLAHEDVWHGAWTHVVNSAMVNTLRYEYSNRYSHGETQGLGGNYPEKLGLQGVSPSAFPQFALTGYNALGSNAQERRQYPIYQSEIVDDFSWVRARHSVKFGFEANRSVNHEVNLPTASGAFSFSTLSTGQPGNAASGNPIASLLLGIPFTFAENQTSVLNRQMWYLAGFLQDDWAVTQNLTLNLGLRWETDTPMIDTNNRMNSFDSHQINPVSGTAGVVKFLGLNGFRTNPYDADLNDFGPRFGFAWKPFASGNTVVRGGYGIFFAHPFDAGVPNQAALGFSTSISITSPDNGLTFPFSLRDGAPPATAPVLNDSFGAVPVGKTPTTAVTYFDPGRRAGYSQQFNLGFQRQLPDQMVVEVSFLGNDGRKLPNATVPINQIPPGVLGPGHSSQQDRPFPQFTNVSILSPTFSISNYYAGLVRFEKRFSHGLNIVSSFTRSKFLDNSFEGGGALGVNNGPYSNYYNRRADYGYSGNDIPNRFSFSAVYELPFGPGKQWLGTNPLRYIAGGWSLSNVTTVQSGPPFTVTAQTNTTNSFSAGSLRPNVLRNPNLDSRAVSRWFDTAAFVQPSAYQFGNEGVGILRAAGLVNFDFSLQRRFQIKEHVRAQFRAEFFNAFNHTNFGVPNSTFGSTNFGVVTSAGPARQIELGARIEF